MKLYKDYVGRDFYFWSGAKQTVELLTAEEVDYITQVLEELWPDGMDETQFNDIFWFETDWIAEELGYPDFETLYKERTRRNSLNNPV